MSQQTTVENDLTARQPLTLDEAVDASLCGHKAATLAALRRSGHQVPDGFVIPVGGSTAPDVVGDALERLGPGPYAVRSSGVAEDLADASFAGQYESVLGVDTLDDVIAAIERVLASSGTEHAAAYSAGIDHGQAPLAVLVQRLVRPDAAGVMFSANPVSGDDEVVIEAVPGLGDRLVSGEEDADRWVDRNGRVEAITDSGVIDAPVVRRLGDLARRIARERGEPQDIEWALAGETLFVLQARAITHLPSRPKIEIPPGRWMKDTGHFSGPLTPMGTSILPVAEAALSSACAEFGLPLDGIRMRSFGGEFYAQDIDVGGKHDPSSPPPWWVLAIACRLVPVMRRRLRGAETAIPKLEEYPRLWNEEWRDDCLRRIEAASSIELGTLTDAELLGELKRLVDEILVPHMTIHFQLNMPHVVGVHELFVCCNELLGWDLPRVLSLLTGLSTTTAPTREMAEITEQIDGSVLAEGLAAVRATAAGPKLDAWLGLWGLRTIDLDPGSPMIAERDDLVVGLIASARGSSRELDDKRQASIAEARAALRASERERFDRSLAYAEIVYPLREDNVPYTEGLPCGLVRRVLLEIGTRLTAAGALRSPGDVAFLEAEELRPALEATLSGETARERVRRRRAEHAWVLAHPGPSVHGPAPVPPPDVRGLPKAARRITQAMLWSFAEEDTPPGPPDGEDGAIAGVGASPGRYTGPVRKIMSAAELGRVKPGDVLVCPTTHSSWAVVFSHIGALVTDGGGMLSHPAIIAREYDIPAVLATGRATSTLIDGQIVTVDGATGRVRIH